MTDDNRPTPTLRPFIDGRYVESSTEASFALVDPSTGKSSVESPQGGGDDLDAAFGAADRAFAHWRKSTPAQRQKALLGIADDCLERAQELADAEVISTGKIRAHALGEVSSMVDQIRFFAGAARNLEGRSAGEYATGTTSWVRREPVGVIGQITPWNYPMMMAAWKFAPAIAAGNTVVLKPSDSTPQSTLLLAEIASDHLPDGTLNVVLGNRNTGADLVAHPRPDMVSITGSIGAGRAVATSAATDLKRVHLELGGKAPVVVFADADLDAAAKAIASSGFYNAGQDCTAATRVIVEASVAEEFSALLARVASATRVGGPDDADAHFGAIITAEQLDRIESAVLGIPGHAEILAGGRRIERGGGSYFEPTIVAGLGPGDSITRDEIFGPVLTVQTFTDEHDAMRLANDSRYALASSVWTNDISVALRCSAALDYGCVWINTHLTLVAEMPHGGFKHSGYGKDLSAYGFEDYTRLKHVMARIG